MSAGFVVLALLAVHPAEAGGVAAPPSAPAATASPTIEAEPAPEPAATSAPLGGDAEPAPDVPVTPAVPAAAQPKAPSTAPAATTPDASYAGHPRGPVLLPYLGFNLPVGSLADDYSAGFRFGVLAGWHVRPRLSINGEVAVDLMDADADSSILKPHEHYLDVALSPLLHLRSSTVVVGPKLGWFRNSRSKDADLQFARRVATMFEHTGQGVLLGINAGGFVGFGRVALGLLASASVRHFLSVDCGGHACGDFGNVVALDLSVAILF